MDGFNFPFVRDQPYSLGELRRFHNDVVSARRQHPALSRRIRGHNVPWAKLFLEELSPAMLFADNNQIPDFHEFRAMPEGNPADIQLISPGAVVRLQVTTAYPEWDASANAQRGWSGGYIKSLERDGINRGAAVFGGGRTIRTVGGDIEFGTSIAVARSGSISLARGYHPSNRTQTGEGALVHGPHRRSRCLRKPVAVQYD